ncbi:SRPBCC family protein [Nitriliruptor alkaliphilus]|uniref:SRPBCC family protein n=1 Tax=Nitriliruptor alkaliphilus TaxID=427918 RepID=UPI00069864EF|nr:SRPBCC family protein [Nitriliruptor alkaliphilus]
MNRPLLGTVDRDAGAVHLERVLSVPPHEVWAALTDPARLRAWLGHVIEGRPGPAARFVLRMDDQETATCTVTTWDPPRELGLTWDYTGEGPSVLRLGLVDIGGGTRLTLDHERLPVDPVQYGAGWHAHLDALDGHLTGAAAFEEGCEGADFAAAFDDLMPRYAAVAVGGASHERTGG